MLKHECEACGRMPREMHHVVFRSQCKAMIKARINHVYLCPEHHRGMNGVHGKNGRELDIKLKMELQQKLFQLFNRESYIKKDVKELLGISHKESDMLLKIVSCKQGKYDRVDVVRACMGGMLYAD